jgi:hypothetical protein
MRIAAITFFLILCSLARTGLAGTPPQDNTRILHTFDFEERAQGNDEDQPMHWDKLDGIDLPHYVTGHLSTDRHRSGKYSFRMDLDGGSCIYRYQPTLLKVRSQAHYRFEGYCQTTYLRYARARLTAYFTDLDGHPLPESVRHSDLYASEDEDPQWHLMSVELTADQDRAAYLVVQMELLQPNMYFTSTLGQRALFLQDVHGSAWFDDLAVSQVPQVLLKTDRPGNIFRQGDPLNLSVIVNDREIDDLSVQLVVTDALDHRIYQHTGAVDVASAKGLGSGIKELTMQLPKVPAGWYRASLMMMSNGVYVGQESMAWIQLADAGNLSPPDPRFSMVATNLTPESWDGLTRLLPLFSVGNVKLALWSSKVDVQKIDADKFDLLLENLFGQGISTTGCLVELPPRLNESLNGATWLQILDVPDDAWQAQLSFLISRHANRIARWQIGSDDTDQFAVNPDMRKVFHKVYDRFANLIDHPDVAMPCPMLFDLPVPIPSTVVVSVPPSVLPVEIPLYLQEYQEREGSGTSLSLSMLDRNRYGRETQIRDLTQRIIYSLASNVPRIDLPLPLEVRHPSEQTVTEPMEAALIMRTLLSTLSGSTFQGKIPLSPEIEAFLFEKGGQGIIVLWSKNDLADGQPLSISLGKRPMRVDLWGNATPMMQTVAARGEDDDETSRHTVSAQVQLKAGRMPIILTGIDIDIAKLRTSLAIDRPLIESTFQQHTRHIRFTNPCSVPVSGTLKLHPPSGWDITPSSFAFTLNTGETFDRDLDIEFPYNTIAGPQNITADFNVQGDRHFTFSQPLSVSVGLSDVGTQCMAFRDGADIVVQQMITNYGDQPINYATFASYPGRPRIERLISTLRPSQTAIKRFRFTNVPAGPTAKIRIGLKEIDGNRILNDEVEIK